MPSNAQLHTSRHAKHTIRAHVGRSAQHGPRSCTHMSARVWDKIGITRASKLWPRHAERMSIAGARPPRPPARQEHPISNAGRAQNSRHKRRDSSPQWFAKEGHCAERTRCSTTLHAPLDAEQMGHKPAVSRHCCKHRRWKW
eukprot:7378514-Prymnesium_polylepis.1